MTLHTEKRGPAVIVYPDADTMAAKLSAAAAAAAAAEAEAAAEEAELSAAYAAMALDLTRLSLYGDPLDKDASLIIDFDPPPYLGRDNGTFGRQLIMARQNTAMGPVLVAKEFDQLISFTRTSAATYVNSAGNIVTTPASKNLLLWSEAFDNGTWTKTSATITANSLAAPDGLMTADTLTDDGTSSRHSASQSLTIAASAAHTVSLYVKVGTGRYFTLSVSRGAAGSVYYAARYDLQSVTVTATGAGGGGGTHTSSSITAVGDGWYRCVLTGVLSTFTDAVVMASGAINPTGFGDRGAEIYTGTGLTWFIWGAQLETGSTATSYVRNFGGLFPPRFDYHPVTLQPRGLLIEEQRTNLLLRSEEFDNASWTKTAVTATANATTSPDGTADADSIIETTANSAHDVNQFVTLSAVAYTYSVFVKANGRSWVRLFVFQSGPGSTPGQSVWFNVSTGVVGTVGAGASNATITNFGNGWYRCAFTFTAIAASASLYAQLATADNGVSTYTGDGTSGIYIWGAQLEAGAFATSYIPTVASQVTRTADQASIVAPMFAPWYNQSEGTFVVEFDTTQTGLNAATSYLLGFDNSASKRVVYIGMGGDVAATFDGTTILGAAGDVTGPAVKVASAYNGSGRAIVTAGGAVTTGAVAVGYSSASSLNIGQMGGSQQLDGHIRSIRYFPTRLSNAQLQALTA